MRIRRVMTFTFVAVLAGVAWMTVGLEPSAAAPGAETVVAGAESFDTMHVSCASSDVVAMHGTTESLTDADWSAMSSHMDSNQMGSGMMGQGMMDPTGHHATAMGTELW